MSANITDRSNTGKRVCTRSKKVLAYCCSASGCASFGSWKDSGHRKLFHVLHTPSEVGRQRRQGVSGEVNVDKSRQALDTAAPY
jgi:hypothetical protein